jgi:hypothetical protein
VLTIGITASYIMTAVISFNLSADLERPIGLVVVVIGLAWLVFMHDKHKSIAA